MWDLHSRLPEFSLETGPKPFSYLTPRLLSHKKRRVGNKESIYESPIGVLCQDTFSGVSHFKPKERGHARPLGESDVSSGGAAWGTEPRMRVYRALERHLSARVRTGRGSLKDRVPWRGLDAGHSKTSAGVRTGRRSLQERPS